jgi:protein associated with RNAse G/E
MDIEIQAFKHDGSLHLRYSAEWLSEAPIVIQTLSPRGTAATGSKGQGEMGEDWHGHFWPDRWFNIVRYSANERHPAGWYCNVASPANLDGTILRYTDYEIDVRVQVGENGDLEYRILDEDEFEEARIRYNYDEALVARCRAAVDQIIAMVKAREFPFEV